MKKNKKLIALIAAIVVAFAAVVWFILNGASISDITSPSGRLINFSGADLREEKDGKIVWALTADTIEYDPKTKAITMKNLKGTFNQNDIVMQLTAPQAVMSSDHKQLDMTGGIEATTSEGVEFNIESLHFDNTTKELSSTSPFTYKGKGVTLTGDGLVANMSMQKVTVNGHAKLVKD